MEGLVWYGFLVVYGLGVKKDLMVCLIMFFFVYLGD